MLQPISRIFIIAFLAKKGGKSLLLALSESTRSSQGFDVAFAIYFRGHLPDNHKLPIQLCTPLKGTPSKGYNNVNRPQTAPLSHRTLLPLRKENQRKLIPFPQLNIIMLAHQRNELINAIIKNMEPSSENTLQSQQSLLAKDKLLIKKVNNRSFKKYRLQVPSPYTSVLTPQHHVYKVFNTFGINQLALTTPDFEQSFLRTYFYHRIVTKVEKYQNAVVISIIPSAETINQPPLPYIIEKLKAYGSKELFQLASLIEQLWTSLEELKNKKMDAIIQEDKESVAKYLNMLGKEMFFIKFGLYKIALSNSLLTYLGYDIDQFCVETVKYRTILFDFMSSNTYHKISSHALGTLKCLMQVDLQRMSIEDYIALSRMQFRDYIYSKDHKKTYCDIEFTIPVRGIILFRYKKLHYQTDELKWKPYCSSYEENASTKSKINQREFQLLNQIGVIPGNWLTKSKVKVAGYRSISNLPLPPAEP